MYRMAHMIKKLSPKLNTRHVFVFVPSGSARESTHPWCEKSRLFAFFEPFSAKNDHFAKTRSGQTHREQVETKGSVLRFCCRLRGVSAAAVGVHRDLAAAELFGRDGADGARRCGCWQGRLGDGARKETTRPVFPFLFLFCFFLLFFFLFFLLFDASMAEFDIDHLPSRLRTKQQASSPFWFCSFLLFSRRGSGRRTRCRKERAHS